MAIVKKTKTKKASAEKVRIIAPPFRISYPHIFKATRPMGDEDAEPKFSLTAIWRPDDFAEGSNAERQWRKLRAEMDRVSNDAFGVDWKDLKEHDENIRVGLRNGKSKTTAGYGPGTVFASMSSKNPPGVIDEEGNTISLVAGNTDLIYPGCWCQASVTVYAFDNIGKGIAFGLQNVKKLKDAERIDSRVAAEDDFDEDVDSEFLNPKKKKAATDFDDDDDEPAPAKKKKRPPVDEDDDDDF